jgi:hypothetical protein
LNQFGESGVVHKTGKPFLGILIKVHIKILPEELGLLVSIRRVAFNYQIEPIKYDSLFSI